MMSETNIRYECYDCGAKGTYRVCSHCGASPDDRVAATTEEGRFLSPLSLAIVIGLVFFLLTFACIYFSRS